MPISSCIRPLPIGVFTPVGCTLLTRMPYLPSSAANALAMPRTANLLVVYGIMNGCTFRPAAELMMMTEPPPALTRCGAPTMTVFQVPVTLVLIVSSKICGVVWSQALGTQIPAFATTTSSRPS